MGKSVDSEHAGTSGSIPETQRIRLISRLDIKGSNLIKGVHLEGLRKVGSAVDFATRYYEEGIDEILVMDVVASLYGRPQILDVVRTIAEQVFVPLTVGGGVRSVDDFESLLRSGADKVAVNSAAIRNPEVIEELARKFGRQSVVLSVEAQGTSPGRWEALTDNGRERSGLDVIEWVTEATARGAGEVLITSIDREGTRTGFDVELTSAVTKAVRTPVVASGGMGSVHDFITLAQSTDVAGIAMADVLHFRRLGLEDIRAEARHSGLDVRDHA